MGPQGPVANITTLQAQVAVLTTLVNNQAAQIANMQQITQYMYVDNSTINGLAGPHVIFSGANVHNQSGSGTTYENGSPSGLGNLVIGYNEIIYNTSALRTGSHNLIVGMDHTYTNSAGLVAGYFNTVTGWAASVSGGTGNTAGGDWSSVSGGVGNGAQPHEWMGCTLIYGY